MNKRFIKDLIHCRYVDRLQGKRKILKYDLMQHQWMTANLFIYFASLEDVSYTANELRLIMNHDILETITNDLPYTVKNFSEETRSYWGNIEDCIVGDIKNCYLRQFTDQSIKEHLTPRQYALFKCCDLLDLYLFVEEEACLGNVSRDLAEVKCKCEEIINKLAQENHFYNISKYI